LNWVAAESWSCTEETVYDDFLYSGQLACSATSFSLKTQSDWAGSIVQSALKRTKDQLESEQQALAAMQAELVASQQQQDATHRSLQAERSATEEQVRKVRGKAAFVMSLLKT